MGQIKGILKRKKKVGIKKDRQMQLYLNWRILFLKQSRKFHTWNSKLFLETKNYMHKLKISVLKVKSLTNFLNKRKREKKIIQKHLGKHNFSKLGFSWKITGGDRVVPQASFSSRCMARWYRPQRLWYAYLPFDLLASRSAPFPGLLLLSKGNLHLP